VSELISDNYFCRLSTITFAGGSAVRTVCATVRSRDLRLRVSGHREHPNRRIVNTRAGAS
jgi:hypothetical protein